MPLSLSDFEAHESQVAGRSTAFDPERPFLFEGLAPRYATKVVRSCFIPMRDGVRLSTDFHIPVGAKLPLPVVLSRTPYGKSAARFALHHIFPEQGFIYAVQDVRGRYESEGEFIACSAIDRQDGYDTVDWLVSQPWCDGAVGAFGSSYVGETAAKLAAARHANHRASVICFDGSYAGGLSRNGAFLQSGVTMLRMLLTWFRDYVPKVSYGPPAYVDREAWFSSAFAQSYATQPLQQPEVNLERLLETLPVFNMLDRSGAAPSDFAEMMCKANDASDPFWNGQGFLTDADHVDTPTLHITGPQERGGSSPDNFRLFRSNGSSKRTRDNQVLIFSPAPHSGFHLCREHTRYGIRNFGDTRLPYYKIIVAWFAHWLRGEATDVEAWPQVQYFVAGHNVWKTADEWPPSDVEPTRFYLRSDGAADRHPSDGRLSMSPPEATEPADRFVYDPANPTPSEIPDTPLDLLGGGYCDRSSLELRSDTLVYTSEVLKEGLEIVGGIEAVLHVSSSAKDTDFVAVLVEVDDEGAAINIIHGIARMRYREGLDRQVFMAAGEIYEVKIDLWFASIYVPAGHRIGLHIASSHFPAFDRNLNTGGDNYTASDWLVAENEVHHNPLHPSYLLLPLRRPAKSDPPPGSRASQFCERTFG